jgi:thiamine-phosphate pyrophosphorylase
MRIEYSAAVELALAKASFIAQQAQASHVRPEDLVRGLLEEEEGRPAVLLQGAGVTLEKLRSLLPKCEGVVAAAGDLPLAPATGEIMAVARELARLHAAEGTITSEHLLLAVLEEDPSWRSLLEGIGLDFAALKEQITPTAPPLRLEEPFEWTPAAEAVDTARILDASANRAREALRVLEDYARFVRGDAFLTSQLKDLRHRLAEALGELPCRLLLCSRDTLHDVGTTITTAREQERASSLDVAQANAKRLQEALRSLEEFGKVLSPVFGAAAEELRYRSYTVELALLGSAAAVTLLADVKLFVLVTEALCRTSLAGTVREALAGGAQIIQLREKDVDDRTFLERARDVRKMTRSAGALFIVNDRPDIARLAEADGVHLGQDDLPLREARRLLGPDALIGISTHDLDQVRQAVLEGASYIGVGPTFASKTKDFGAFPGLDFVRQAAAETSLPAFVLGGVTAENLHEVLAAGGKRVAVSHAVCAAEDPKGIVERMRRMLDGR